MRQTWHRRERPWHADPARLAVTALAAHRLTRLATVDSLPVLEQGRRWVEDNLPEKWAAGVRCPWCWSVHIAAATVVVAELAERTGRARPWWLVATALAASSVVGLVAEREVA